MKGIALLFIIPVLAAVPVFRTVRRWCRHRRGRRPWLIAGALIVLGMVVTLVPWVFELRPPFSESPSGLILIFAKGEALGIVGVAALATILAAAIPPASSDVDPAP